MVWWYWVVFGLALLAVELATPGGLLALFFGIAALMVGALALFGIAGPGWVQWLLFSILSVASLLLLRGPLQARFNVGHRNKPVDALEGETAIVLEDIRPGDVGRVELRGATWSARTDGALLAKGARCRVARREGLMLWVHGE